MNDSTYFVFNIIFVVLALIIFLIFIVPRPELAIVFNPLFIFIFSIKETVKLRGERKTGAAKTMAKIWVSLSVIFAGVSILSLFITFY